MLITSRMPRSFGIEEEFLLLDERTGEPLNCARDVVLEAQLHDESPDREYFQSQLEIATPVCTEASQALDALGEKRRTVSEAAAHSGAVLASTALPPVGGEKRGSVTPQSRYRHIAHEMRAVAEHQFAVGTHVHVEIPDRSMGVAVIAHIARWVPVLLAMSANSPFWCGEATGFASWRHVMSLQWPASGYPEPFDDASDYDGFIVRMVTSGVLTDANFLPWVVRLSQHYPTLELRVADAQFSAEESVAFALIVRALVDQAIDEITQTGVHSNYQVGLINGANWVAARNGLRSTLIDTHTARSVEAFTLVDRMRERIDAHLHSTGDAERVDVYLEQLRLLGEPAWRQEQVHLSDGLAGLLNLYKNGLSLGAHYTESN